MRKLKLFRKLIPSNGGTLGQSSMATEQRTFLAVKLPARTDCACITYASICLPSAIW